MNTPIYGRVPTKNRPRIPRGSHRCPAACRHVHKTCVSLFVVSRTTKQEHRFLSVPLPARLDDALDEIAAEMALSRAAVARLALRAFLLSNAPGRVLSEALPR